MSIDNIAFVIPIHPPHYTYIYNFIHKLKSNSIVIDIYLVFSNHGDYNRFEMKLDIIPIIISESLNNNSIITFKKFYGLKTLIDSKYDYFICCDSEIDIIPINFTKDNLTYKITEIFNNKCIYAGDVTGNDSIINISRTSANLFPHKYDILCNITNNFNLYFWWSDLPVYRRKDLSEFFNMINYDNILFAHFDHLIYQYYLILIHEFKIINTTPITNIKWSLELLNKQDINILNGLSDIKYGFSWVTKSNYNLNIHYIISKKGFLIYHLDRNLENIIPK
jgi:hypothetical protein